MTGIVSYGSYIPFWKLDRTAISSAIGGRPRSGWRAVASYDEDTTTMGVEAARHAIRSLNGPDVGAVVFATAEPAYLQKSNANAVHAALDLDTSVPTFDMVGNARSGIAAMLLAERLGGIAVISDMRNGPSGSTEESDGADVAAALQFGDDRVIAELVGAGHATLELMDRWRFPGERFTHSSDERFVEHVYAQLTDAAVAAALKDADIGEGAVDHLVVSASTPRIGRLAARSFRTGHAVATDLWDRVGHGGVAHWALSLTDALDDADPDRHIAVVVMADGVSVLVFHATNHLVSFRAERDSRTIPKVIDQVEARAAVPYTRFLGWRGVLQTDVPRAADPQPFSPVVAERNARWKYGFVASRDDHGYIHMPPARVAAEGGAVDEMTPVRMADVLGTASSLTVDHATYSPGGAVIYAVVDFDGGGRATVEITDAEPGDVQVGERVEMTFRRLGTSPDGHNYFWKARPCRRVRAY